MAPTQLSAERHSVENKTSDNPLGHLPQIFPGSVYITCVYSITLIISFTAVSSRASYHCNRIILGILVSPIIWE